MQHHRFKYFHENTFFLQSMKIGKWINSIVYLREKCKNFLFRRTFNEQEIALILKSLMKIFKRNWPRFAVIDLLRGQIHLPSTHSWYLRKYLKYILHVCTLIKNCNDFGIYTHDSNIMFRKLMDLQYKTTNKYSNWEYKQSIESLILYLLQMF